MNTCCETPWCDIAWSSSGVGEIYGDCEARVWASPGKTGIEFGIEWAEIPEAIFWWESVGYVADLQISFLLERPARLNLSYEVGGGLAPRDVVLTFFSAGDTLTATLNTMEPELALELPLGSQLLSLTTDTSWHFNGPGSIPAHSALIRASLTDLGDVAAPSHSWGYVKSRHQ